MPTLPSSLSQPSDWTYYASTTQQRTISFPFLATLFPDIPQQNMEQYVQHATTHQLPTLVTISLLLGLGKGGVPGLATVATAATVLTAPEGVAGGLGE